MIVFVVFRPTPEIHPMLLMDEKGVSNHFPSKDMETIIQLAAKRFNSWMFRVPGWGCRVDIVTCP